MADISSVVLSNGSAVNFKDSAARESAQNALNQLEGKLNIAQGVQYKGKILQVSNSGNLELVDAPSGSGTGDVTGPNSSTDAHVVVFDGLTGKAIKDSGFTIGTNVPSDAVFTDTTYESKTAANEGTDESLVTTGEKYIWNHKANVSDIPTKTSDLTNDSGFLTSHQDISGKADAIDVMMLEAAMDEKADLDENGKVPASQLPSYVDDVVEYADTDHFPLTGESGKIYIAIDTGHTYRWSGSQYVDVGTSGDGQVDPSIIADIEMLKQRDEVTYAHQIVTDDEQQSQGEYLIRTTGGDASLSDGPAKLLSIQGRCENQNGNIVVSNPKKFISTGWNLYNHNVGYARVIKYSNDYGFMVGGTYTSVSYSETPTGTRVNISPDANGHFNIEDDGYVFIGGGNSTDTYLLMTWSDCGNGYDGEFKTYEESVVDFTDVMTACFPYGLMQVGNVYDEINFGTSQAISRIERIANTESALETITESGRAFINDDSYIYAVRVNPIVTEISVSGDYTASDHGLEIINGGIIPVFVQTLYGENLVDKLRHDIPIKLSEHDERVEALENRTVNGQKADTNGNWQVDEVTYSRQIVTDESQQDEGVFLIRTTGGEASISDGEGKLVSISGRSEHTGVIKELLSVHAIPVERYAPAPISATLNDATFREYVSEGGLYTLYYTNAWNQNPSLYGVTVTGTPINGDRISIDYDKVASVEESITVDVEMVEREMLPPITASLNETTFKNYISNSGTYTLTYDGSVWSSSLALYGITVTGVPVEGDEIVITYAKSSVVPEVLTATASTGLSATINSAKFKSVVSDNVTITFTYSGGLWNYDPTVYGVTVTGTLSDGCYVTVVYEKQYTDPGSLNMVVNTVGTRPYESDISATVDNATFKSKVSDSSIINFYYINNEWDRNLTQYGVTVSGTPKGGDCISIEYVKAQAGSGFVSMSVSNAQRIVPLAFTAEMTDKSSLIAYADSLGLTDEFRCDYIYSESAEKWIVVSGGDDTDPHTTAEMTSDLGITITNTPVDGDVIELDWIAENRGTITHTYPTKFVSTGWNLYDHDHQYAHVLKYSNQYGFIISGTYTSLSFSTSSDGSNPVSISVTDGHFTVPSDGYVLVNGGNNTNTAIYMTWSDWQNGTDSPFMAYHESIIDGSSIMADYFPYGLMAVDGYSDEVDFSTNTVISRIQRLAYSSENLEIAVNSGRPYDADENYIYLVKASPDRYQISSINSVDSYDHGLEYVISSTNVAPKIKMLYGQNLVDKLRHDVVVKSDILDMVYPVGSIYMSVASTSPSTLFGGTWEQLQDRFLIGASSTYTAGATGGSASASYTPSGTVGDCTLSVNQIPSHDHSFTGSSATSDSNSIKHAHGLNSHTHSIDSHTHSLSSHTHTGPSHTHSAQMMCAQNVAGSSGAKRLRSTADVAYAGTGGNPATWLSFGDSNGNNNNSYVTYAGTGNTGGPSNNTSGGPSVTLSAKAATGNTAENTCSHSHKTTATGTVGSKGGSQAHNHGFTGTAATIATMPPYLAVFMWKRTA